MPFDIEAARKSGATDDAITNFLATKHGFDLQKALDAGASQEDILNSLANRRGGQQPATGAPSTLMPSLVGKKRPLIPKQLLPKEAAPALPDVDVTTGAEAPERIMASFFNSPEGKQQVLAEKYGMSNTRVVEGAPEFMNPKTGKWTRFDEDSLSAKDALDIMSDVGGAIVASIGTAKATAAGAAAGGAIGAMTPFPGGMAVGASMGGFLGGLAGGAGTQVTNEAIKRGLQYMFVGSMEEFDPLSEAEEGALAELVAIGFTGSLKVGKKLAKKIVKSRPVKAEAREALMLAKTAPVPGKKKPGIPLTAGQASAFEPKIVRAESFVERFPFAQVTPRKLSEGVDLYGDLARREVTTKIGLPRTREEVGVLIGNAYKARKLALRGTAKKLYGEVELLAGTDTLVPHNAISAMARVQDDIIKSAADAPAAERALRALSGTMGTGKGLTLPEIQGIRSNMLDIARSLKGKVSQKKASRWMAQINNALDKDIEVFGGNFGYAAVDKLRAANAIYRKEANELFQPIVGDILYKAETGKMAIEDLALKFIQKGKTGKITAPRQLRKILGNDTFEEIQGYVAHNFLEEATVLGVGNEKIISPGKLRKIIEAFGDDSLKEVFPEYGKRQALKNLSKLGSLFVSKGGKELGINPSGTAQALIKTQLALGVAGGAVGYGVEGKQGAISGATVAFLSAPMLSRLLQSKPVVHWLASGDMLSPKLERRLAIAARTAVIGIMNRMQAEEKSQFRQKIPSPSLKGL